MKRMTKKIGKHYTFRDCEIICDKCFGGCKVSQRVMDKYGELEDLLEEELGTVDLELTKSVFDEWHSYLQFAGERNAFEQMLDDVAGEKADWERLRELAQADREGRCVVLPAPLGSQVWQFKYPTRIDENGEEWTICSVRKATVEPAPFGLTLSMVNQIGKIYWLSEEDALAELRREQE